MAVRATTLVVGGSGFVGSHLLERLVATSGGPVRSLDIAPPKWTVPGVDYVVGDVRAPLELDGAEQIARIYNLAAVHRTPGHPDHEYYETNVRGAMNVTEFADRHGITTIVFTSSISVYGPTEEPTDERSPLHPNSSYGRSKRIAEEIHHGWLTEAPDQRRVVIVRPAVIFGHGENGNFERLRKALWAKRFVYPGRTDTIKSCGYVGELLNTFEWALAQGDSFTYNYAYPARTTITEICEAFHEVEGAPAPRGTIPAAAVVSAAKAFQVISRMGAPAAFHPERVRKLMHSTNVVPGVLVERNYPWKTDLRGGLREWFADEDRRGVAPPR